MPEDLKALVQAAADESGRSLHAELLHRIQKSFKDEENDRIAEMLYEMRRTQLHLELNTLKADIGALFPRARELRMSLEGMPDGEEAAKIREELDAQIAKKHEIERKSRDVLSRLVELDRSHGKVRAFPPHEE